MTFMHIITKQTLLTSPSSPPMKSPVFLWHLVCFLLCGLLACILKSSGFIYSFDDVQVECFYNLALALFPSCGLLQTKAWPFLLNVSLSSVPFWMVKHNCLLNLCSLCLSISADADLLIILPTIFSVVHWGYRISSRFLTFIVSLDFILKEVALAIPEDEGKEGEDERIQDANDGQDVGPAHWAVPQRVLSCLLTTQVLNHLCIPARRENYTSKHQTHCYRERNRDMLFRPGRKVLHWARNVRK